MDLPGCLHKPVRELSGGMKRRVSIARALLCGNDILIFDEPFSGLDDGTKERVMSLVKRAGRGKTMIWVTHDEREAKFMGSRIIDFSDRRQFQGQ
jgi:NitT/TauT family transport system ATP-binding protein